MLNLNENITHLIALIGLLAAAVLLIIFGHSFINSDYVFGTITTLAGALFGYRFGVGVVPPGMADQLAQAQTILQQNAIPPTPDATHA